MPERKQDTQPAYQKINAVFSDIGSHASTLGAGFFGGSTITSIAATGPNESPTLAVVNGLFAVASGLAAIIFKATEIGTRRETQSAYQNINALSYDIGSHASTFGVGYFLAHTIAELASRGPSENPTYIAINGAFTAAFGLAAVIFKASLSSQNKQLK